MNTIAPRRMKTKGLTVPVQMYSKSLYRQNSENAASILTEIPEYPQNIKSPRNPVNLYQTPKCEINNRIQVLDEMGFGSLVNTNCEPNIGADPILKKRFSIGISDFWTGSNKQKFLRENGYKEAFDTLKKDSLIRDLQKNTSLRKPTLPYIMDSNTKRRNLVHMDKVTSIFAGKEQHLPKLPIVNIEKYSGKLDNVVEKCNILAHENQKFKILTERMRNESSLEKKKKITKEDREKINIIVQSMN